MKNDIQNIEDQKIKNKGRRPIIFLTVVFVLTWVVLTWFGWNTWNSYQTTKTDKEYLSKTEELCGKIIHLDEVLTMSARMAAVTGNLQWEKRYRIFEPKLDAAIKEAMRLAPEGYIGKAASDTRAANIRLVEMENQSFDLVRQGRIDEAKALLLSDEYEKKKRIYAQKMIPFTAGLVVTARTNLQDEQRQAFKRLGIVLLLISLLIIVWFVAFRVVSNWKKTLIDKRGLEKEITERKRAEEALSKAHDELERKVQDRTAQLKKAKEAAEAASKAKSLFIANMSHELRTPLSGIIVSADLALRQELSPKVVKIQETISRSSQALLRTVNTILDFSKSEDGKLELAAVPFRLDETLGKLSGTFVQKGAQKQIKISFDIAADEVPNALIGDPDRLVDVFNHLLDNAAKFSTSIPKAVIGVRDVGTSAKKATLEFYVKDNGIGIASEDFEKIFDAFTQVDPSNTRQYDGTGMGLAVSKRLVEQMEGTIRVESELGKGSTFYFTASFGRQDQEHPFKAPSFKDQEDTTVSLTSSKPGGKRGSPEFLLELLSTIDPFIQKRKPKQCKEIMAEISGYAWPDEFAQEIVELDRLIGKYKFKDAYTILESVVKKLKSSIS